MKYHDRSIGWTVAVKLYDSKEFLINCSTLREIYTARAKLLPHSPWLLFSTARQVGRAINYITASNYCSSLSRKCAELCPATKAFDAQDFSRFADSPFVRETIYRTVRRPPTRRRTAKKCERIAEKDEQRHRNCGFKRGIGNATLLRER